MARTWDGRDLYDADLLRAAAQRTDNRTLAELFTTGAEAFPIDLTAPPRNPLDRRVVLKVLALAAEVVRDVA